MATNNKKNTEAEFNEKLHKQPLVLCHFASDDINAPNRQILTGHSIFSLFLQFH